MSDIKQKLDRIRDRISDPSFLANKGLSNEVGIHVLCYDPADELIVRDFVSRLKAESGTPYHIKECDLYEIFLKLLEDKRVLKSVAGLEDKRGKEYLLKQLQKIATPEALLEYIQQTGRLLTEKFQAETVITGINHESEDGQKCISNLICQKNSQTWITTKKEGGSYSGTGDLFASVLCADMVKGRDIALSVQKAVNFLAKGIHDAVKEGTDRNEGICFETYLYELADRRR